MLRAYFDESGSDRRSPNICVGGFLFTTTNAVAFAREWKAVLRAERVPYLHMKEFAHSRGPFTAWKRDERRRRHFLGALLDIINKRRSFAIGCMVPTDEFARRTTSEWRQRYGSAYTVALQHCLMNAGIWAAAHVAGSERIGYVFEAGDKHQGEVVVRMQKLLANPISCEELRFATYTFADKSAHVGLQAADLYAYELHKMFRENEDGRLSYRHPFVELHRRPDESIVTIMRGERLQQYLDMTANVDKRIEAAQARGRGEPVSVETDVLGSALTLARDAAKSVSYLRDQLADITSEVGPQAERHERALGRLLRQWEAALSARVRDLRQADLGAAAEDQSGILREAVCAELGRRAP